MRSNKKINTCRCGCGEIVHKKWAKGHNRKGMVSELRLDLVGRVFGRLTVIERDEESCPSRIRWLCKCVCGNIKSINGSKLVTKNTKSCGCLNSELSSYRAKTNNPMNRVDHPQLGKTGKLAPNWGKRKKDPKTPETTLIRMSYEYNEWRGDIFERDDYRCQKCEVVGGTLNAHHIASFSDNRSLRFVLENGITFYKNCHLESHTIYGRGNNTLGQLENFLMLHDGTV